MGDIENLLSLGDIRNHVTRSWIRHWSLDVVPEQGFCYAKSGLWWFISSWFSKSLLWLLELIMVVPQAPGSHPTGFLLLPDHTYLHADLENQKKRHNLVEANGNGRWININYLNEDTWLTISQYYAFYLPLIAHLFALVVLFYYSSVLTHCYSKWNISQGQGLCTCPRRAQATTAHYKDSHAYPNFTVEGYSKSKGLSHGELKGSWWTWLTKFQNLQSFVGVGKEDHQQNMVIPWHLQELLVDELSAIPEFFSIIIWHTYSKISFHLICLLVP